MIKVNLKTMEETDTVLFASERESVYDILAANGIPQPSGIYVMMDDGQHSLEDAGIPIRKLTDGREVSVAVTVSSPRLNDVAESIILPFPNTGKVLLFGCAAMVVSDFTPDELMYFKKHNPDVLKLKGEDGKTVFTVDIREDGPGFLDDESAVFSMVRSGNGKATITVLVDPDADDKTATLRNMLKTGLQYLHCVEVQIAGNMARADGSPKTALLQ